MNAETVPTSSHVVARVDLFRNIHKAIRFALSDLLATMGATDFEDQRSAARVVETLEVVLALCEDHKGHEERVVFPALRARLKGPLASVEAAHVAQERVARELRALGVALLRSTPRARTLAGRTLYLHFGAFVGDLLVHMGEEECMLQPLLERHFGDDELRALYGRIMESMSAPEKARSARWILRATNRPERAEIVRGLLESAPRETVGALLEIARPTLVEADFDALLEDTGLVA